MYTATLPGFADELYLSSLGMVIYCLICANSLYVQMKANGNGLTDNSMKQMAWTPLETFEPGLLGNGKKKKPSAAGTLS